MSTSTITPSIQVRDVKATLEWFTALGFATEFAMKAPDGSIVHAEVARDGVRLMLGPVMGEATVGSAGMSLYITLPDSIDGYAANVTAKGITLSDALTDQFWGDRTFTVTHPDGYMIMFAQHLREVSEDEMKAAMAQMAGAPA